jgi:hypothetical protein
VRENAHGVGWFPFARSHRIAGRARCPQRAASVAIGCPTGALGQTRPTLRRPARPACPSIWKHPAWAVAESRLVRLEALTYFVLDGFSAVPHDASYATPLGSQRA